MAKITVRPVESASDITALGDIAVAAYTGDEIMSWIYPGHEQYSWTIRRHLLEKLKLRMAEPGVSVFVGEIDGEAAGYAVWKQFGADPSAAEPVNEYLLEEVDRQLLEIQKQNADSLDKAVDADALKQYLSVHQFAFYKSLAESRFLHLGGFAVKPKHQKKGIGRAMINWGFPVAEEAKIPITLEATPIGRVFYAKLGFVTIQRNKMRDDLEAVAMLWESPALKGQWLDVGADGDGKLKVLT